MSHFQEEKRSIISPFWLKKQQRFFLYLGLFAFILFTVFIHNNSLSIWDQDEGAYALFAKNMIETGNWIIPDALWSNIHRKPPLHFWNIAISFKVFGMNEFALRLPSALFSIFTYLFTLWAGGKLFGKKTAFVAVIILSTSLLVALVAKVSVVDSTLLFFMTVCAFSILFILQKKSWKWSVFFWISFALGVLTKGPPVIMFTIVLGGVLVLFHPNRRNLISLHPWLFLPLALLPFTYWCYLTYLKDGGVFLNWMYDWYILKRINGSVLGQTAPPGTHLLIIIICFSTYLIAIPNTLFQTVKHFFVDRKNAMLLGAWFFAGWFIYELSPSKLPTYVLSAHVPFSLLLAQQLLKTKKPGRFFTILHFAFQIALASSFFILPSILENDFINNWIFYGVGIILLATALFSLIIQKTSNAIIGILTFGMVFQVIMITVLLPQVEQFKDLSKKTSAYIIDTYMSERSIVIGNERWSPPSLPFYLSTKFNNISIADNNKTIVSSFFNLDNSTPVLILSKHQLDILQKIKSDIHFTKFSNHAITGNLLNSYFIVESLHQSTSTKITVAPPLPALTFGKYRRHIQNDKKWNNAIIKNAKVAGIDYQLKLDKETAWYLQYRIDIHNFDKQMRTNLNWLSLMQEKAIQKNQTLEKTCAEYAIKVIKFY